MLMWVRTAVSVLRVLWHRVLMAAVVSVLRQSCALRLCTIMNFSVGLVVSILGVPRFVICSCRFTLSYGWTLLCLGGVPTMMKYLLLCVIWKQSWKSVLVEVGMVVEAVVLRAVWVKVLRVRVWLGATGHWTWEWVCGLCGLVGCVVWVLERSS